MNIITLLHLFILELKKQQVIHLLNIALLITNIYLALIDHLNYDKFNEKL